MHITQFLFYLKNNNNLKNVEETEVEKKLNLKNMDWG